MPRHHAAQEGDGLCVPEMEGFWSKMCEPTPKQKTEDLVKMLAEATPTCAERLLSKEETIPPRERCKWQITVYKQSRV